MPERWVSARSVLWKALGPTDIEQLRRIKDELVRSKQDYWAIQRSAARLGDVCGGQEEGSPEIAVKKDVAMENRLWPMRELLGDSLLAMHESAPALKEYETSLLAARNRYRSFYGVAKAAEQLGDGEMAKSYYQKLLPTIWT